MTEAPHRESVSGEIYVCVQAAGQELSLTENRQGLNPRLGGFQQWYGRDFAIADSTG